MNRCPTCNSPTPAWHPATQYEGEVAWICDDPFHEPLTKAARELLAESKAARERAHVLETEQP